MKNIVKKFILALLVIPFFFTGCGDPELPYPLDEVEHGVLIDISRKVGTDPFINALTDDIPDLAVVFTEVEKGAGEFESFDVVIVYNNFAAGTMEKMVYAEGITSLPHEQELDYTAILDYYGLDQEEPGDVFNIVADIKLPSGLIVYGWHPATGFTNSDFASWQHDGRTFSRRVAYPAACPISPEIWEGPAYVHRTNAAGTWENEYENATIEMLEADDLPPASYWEDRGVEPDEYENYDLIGLHLFGIFLEEDYPAALVSGDLSNLKVWINAGNFEVYIPDYHMGVEVNLGALLGAADDWHEIIAEDTHEIELNSCMGILSFTTALTIGDSGYWFSWNIFTVIPEFFLDDKKLSVVNSTPPADAFSKR